ncbi:MAG: hypothetical protein ACYTGD_16150 [Planctomycetota bacterium]|jgi:hypothetical protein
MLISKEFVFIHIPKTAGDFIKKVCQAHFGDDYFVKHDLKKHGPARDLPEPYRDLPVFALVRNPWDWYVSWYHYLMGSGRPQAHRDRVEKMNPFWVRLSDGFRNDFGTTVRNLLDESYWQGEPHPGPIMEMAREQDVGMLTAHYRRLLDDVPLSQLVVGKSETCREDLLVFLRGIRVQVDEELERDLWRRRPVNRSKRGDYREYYDDELRDLVAHKERCIVSGYGYTYS